MGGGKTVDNSFPSKFWVVVKLSENHVSGKFSSREAKFEVVKILLSGKSSGKI